MKKLFALILKFFRSIFKKKQPVPVAEIKPDKKTIRRAYLKKRQEEKDFRRKTWRTPAETRSLIKQLRPGDQVFDKAGVSFAVYRILYRRKLGVLVEDEAGHRWKLHFMGLQSRTFSPDLSL